LVPFTLTRLRFVSCYSRFYTVPTFDLVGCYPVVRCCPVGCYFTRCCVDLWLRWLFVCVGCYVYVVDILRLPLLTTTTPLHVTLFVVPVVWTFGLFCWLRSLGSRFVTFWVVTYRCIHLRLRLPFYVGFYTFVVVVLFCCCVLHCCSFVDFVVTLHCFVVVVRCRCTLRCCCWFVAPFISLLLHLH